MSLVYLVLLAGVALVILFVLSDAILSVTRKPVWEQRDTAGPALRIVATTERRSSNLPFVGADRREAGQPETGSETQRRVA
jgi:hypothetical protein